MYRSLWIWGISTIALLGAFLIFVYAGWPGEINSCIWGGSAPPSDAAQQLTPPPPHSPLAQVTAYQQLLARIKTGNSCFCEEFSVPDAVSGVPGVRQKVNTWFNLYSIGTAFVVALLICFDRRDHSPKLIGSRGWIPDLYVFAVLFLGLGSMWFHGSIKEWGGIFDTLSMYVFTGFLIFFTVRRFWSSDIFFWIAYPLTVIGFTILGELLTQTTHSDKIAVILIVIQVLAYLLVELIASQWKIVKMLTWRWLVALGAIGLATLFWALSQTGKPLCSPTSFWQPHGLLWHPLAGVTALLLFFYWRLDIENAN